MRPLFALLSLIALAIPTTLPAADSNTAAAPPEGFSTLFDGETLSGWIAYPHTDPAKLRKMTATERSAFLDQHWPQAVAHWSTEDGELVNDGQGPYLTTARAYGDFELHLDYKTVAKADSGIYLRGSPQVQIWDATETGPNFGKGAEKGSGALYNNQKHAREPLALADRPFGEWNELRIRLVGDSVTVHLNDVLVVNETTMENYWDRSSPLDPVGPIQLQTHGGEIRFRNLWIKEIPRVPPEAGFLDAKTGAPFGDGWKAVGDGVRDESGAPLTSEATVADFDLHALFTPLNGPGEIAFRSADDGETGMTLTLSPEHGVILSEQTADGPVTVASAPAVADGWKPDGQNHLYLRAEGEYLRAWLNGTAVIDTLYPHGPKSGVVRLSGLNLGPVWLRDLAGESHREPTAEDETGFSPIFNGTDLTGWAGDTAGYAANAGVLVCTPKGGNLYETTDRQNFAFRFEFKLDAGANNGVGIRVPPGGHPAYDGMEIQILDNTNPQYRGIAPYQAHGSVYGVVPAKRGYLNPVGHWNQEEIVADGDRVRVTLNGKVIVDANLREAAADGTIDKHQHPGMFSTGRIGFAGHGHPVSFRNLRVKMLGEATDAE